MGIRQLPFSYAFRNLGRSPVRLIASILGSALVVGLALGAGGFVRGMQQTLRQDASLYENVIVLGVGSEEALERSQIDASVAGIATASVRGIRESGGVPMVSPEINMMLPIRLDGGDTRTYRTVMRGVTPTALLVHSQVEIVEGRAPVSGADELMVGSLAHVSMGVAPDRLGVGERVFFDDRDWMIVGRFSAPATVMDAEVWLPLTDLQIATKRESTLSSVVLSMVDGGFRSADLFAKSRLDLEITAIRETEYYDSLASFYAPIRAMIIVTAVLISVGGVLGGLNTMYAGFASRVREIGMLQSLGYRRVAIAVNMTEESLLASVFGTVLACVVGVTLIDGAAVSFSMGAFVLPVDGPVLFVGVCVGVLVGMIGAVPPAIRCLRMPVTEALKSN